MSIKNNIKTKMFTAAALATVAVGGISTVGAFAANAATPPHAQIYSAVNGTSANPNFVETVYQGVAKAGQPTVMDHLDSSNPGQSLIIPRAGTVSSFYKAGLVSAAVNQHYGNLKAVELEYAPGGTPSGLYVGVATDTAHQNEGLTLQRGEHAGATVFIIDTPDSTNTPGYFPIISGSTTDFTHPFAMTYPKNPDHQPAQIRLDRLNGNPTSVPADQLWGANVK
jgi:hypothetical protein